MGATGNPGLGCRPRVEAPARLPSRREAETPALFPGRALGSEPGGCILGSCIQAAEASSPGGSRKQGCRHLEFPSPGPQDAGSCSRPPRLPLPHLHLAATSCPQGWVRPAGRQGCGWGPGASGDPLSGVVETSSWPQGALEHSLENTAGALQTDGKTEAWSWEQWESQTRGLLTAAPRLQLLQSPARANPAHGACSPPALEMPPRQPHPVLVCPEAWASWGSFISCVGHPTSRSLVLPHLPSAHPQGCLV